MNEEPKKDLVSEEGVHGTQAVQNTSDASSLFANPEPESTPASELFNGGTTAAIGDESSKKKIKQYGLIGVGVLIVIVLLMVIFGQKTMTCTMEQELFGVKMTINMKTKFWFNKSTSVATETVIDLSDLDDDAKEEFKDGFLGEYEDNEDYKIKETDDEIIVTRKEKVDDDKVKSPKEIEEYFEEADYVCK